MADGTNKFWITSGFVGHFSLCNLPQIRSSSNMSVPNEPFDLGLRNDVQPNFHVVVLVTNWSRTHSQIYGKTSLFTPILWPNAILKPCNYQICCIKSLDYQNSSILAL